MDLREDAKILAKNIELHYFDLAKILFEASDATKKVPLYKEWGYLSFKDYVEQELGIKSAKAMYLRKIYYTLEVELSKLDADLKARIRKLGLTKVRHLIRILTPMNATQWVERAESETALSLQMDVEAYIKAFEKAKELNQGNSYADINEVQMPPKIKYVPLNAYFTEDKAEIVKLALERAEHLVSTLNPSKEQLLTIICSEFLTAYPTEATKKALENSFLHKVEQMLGVELIAYKNGEFVYGAELLKSLDEGIIT